MGKVSEMKGNKATSRHRQSITVPVNLHLCVFDINIFQRCAQLDMKAFDILVENCPLFTACNGLITK